LLPPLRVSFSVHPEASPARERKRPVSALVTARAISLRRSDPVPTSWVHDGYRRPLIECLADVGDQAVRPSAGTGSMRPMSPEDRSVDAAVVPRGATGIVLCGEPCALTGSCRLGIQVERLDGADSAYFEIECPADHRESPDLAHGAWTAAILSEMCGVLPVLLGTIAYMGTLTVRFQAPVQMGERLIGRATLDRRERRKFFVSATLSSSSTGSELAKASMIMIAAKAD